MSIWDRLVDWWTGSKDVAQRPSKAKPKATSILCPFCLSHTDRSAAECAECNKGLPPLYVDGYDRLTPSPVQVFGWKNHGKTVYLYALTLMVDRLSQVWNSMGYSCAAVTESCRSRLMEVRRFQRTGDMPPPTPLDFDETYVMLLESMVRWGGRSLIVRDCAGEAFDPMDIDVEQVPFLLKVPTTLMFVSLPDLELDIGQSMDMLLVNYLSTLVRNKGLDRDRNIVVVLSKGDLIRDLPPPLEDYLLNDPLATIVGPVGAPTAIDPQEKPLTAENLGHYLEGMRRASDAIEDWLLKTGLGANMMQLAKQRNITLRYSLISSTGGPVDTENTLPVAWSPRRVLDPYFWAVELGGSLHATR